MVLLFISLKNIVFSVNLNDSLGQTKTVSASLFQIHILYLGLQIRVLCDNTLILAGALLSSQEDLEITPLNLSEVFAERGLLS